MAFDETSHDNSGFENENSQNSDPQEEVEMAKVTQNRSEGAKEEEKDVDKKKETSKKTKVNIFKLYKYASTYEIVLLLLGLVSAVIQGSTLQGPYVFISETIDSYKEFLICMEEVNNQSDITPFSSSSHQRLSDLPYDVLLNFYNVMNINEPGSESMSKAIIDQNDAKLSHESKNKSAEGHFTNKQESTHTRKHLISGSRFQGQTKAEKATKSEEECRKVVEAAAARVSVAVAVCGVVIVVFYFIHVFLFTIVADRLTRKVRMMAFQNILRQNIGYFDVNFAGELNTRLTQDVTKYEIGIGNKVSLMVSWFSTFIAGLVICLLRDWLLTLFMCVLLPFAAIVSGVTTRLMKVYAEKEMSAYAKAGGVAEEALSNIRVVTAFSGQEKECGRYGDLLEKARKVSVKSAMVSSLGQGVPWLSTFTIAGLTIFLTGNMINKGEINPGFMFVLLGCMMQGLRALGFGTALLESVSDSQGAAYGIYEIISAKTTIDSRDEGGDKLQDADGLVQFDNIKFKYPARKDVSVLEGLSLSIKPGQSVALVGPSGCGKSTTIQLLQRFYDPDEGVVKLDGKNVKELNIGWLRSQIGVVSQDPVLFATTIEENIRFGNPAASHEDVVEAAIEADAHVFISALPEKYETLLNEQGTQLSRGEKQRISLARALVRKPKLLLLDECTSALDNESEAAVQAALDKAAKGRTTIIIAHRLSTVKHCDVLFVIDQGVVAESGSHTELLQLGGLYHKLVSTQVVAKEEEKIVTPPPLEVVKRKTRAHTDLSSIVDFSEWKDTEKSVFSSSGFQSLRQLFRLNSNQYILLVSGCVGGLLLGAAWPIFSLLLSHVLGIVVKVDDVMQGVVTSASGIIGLGVAACLVCALSIFMLRYFGESLALKVRSASYRAMLVQEMAWFDKPANQVGTLTSKLADEASRVKMATGSTLLYLSSAISSVFCSVLVALVSAWQLGLTVLPLMPLTIIAGLIQGYMNTTYEKKSHSRTEASGRIASEAIDKIRTIASLNKEQYFLDAYTSHFTLMKREAHRRAVIIGISQSFVWFCSCSIEIVSVGFGMWLVSQGHISFESVFRILVVALVMAAEVGRANSNLPELTSSYTAADNLLSLLERDPQIDVDSVGGVRPDECKGEIEFNSVNFFYPSRPESKVLKNFSLKVGRGQTVAVVGASGGGKSTVVQLLERFYEPSSGFITIDGVDTRELNVAWLRQHLGVVLQEPILFGVTVRENIAYGDNTREVSMEEVVEAAKQANIHNFITSLPLAYETNIGNKGGQLSGGQKQRLSIARALLRNPPVLLLDDATSALDSHSESVVEEALQKARSGRTAIVIAHRLSSIKNADLILYVKRGRVLEAGSHEELLAIKDNYYNLWMANLGNK